MKYLVAILILFSALIGQVDSVYTKTNLYAGEIVGATLENVYIMNETFARKVIPLKYIERIMLKNGEVVFGSSTPKVAYSAYVLGFESTSTKPADTPEAQMIEKLSASNNLDRATKALEDIAFVLKIQLAIAVILLALSVITLS